MWGRDSVPPIVYGLCTAPAHLCWQFHLTYYRMSASTPGCLPPNLLSAQLTLELPPAACARCSRLFPCPVLQARVPSPYSRQWVLLPQQLSWQGLVDCLLLPVRAGAAVQDLGALHLLIPRARQHIVGLALAVTHHPCHLQVRGSRDLSRTCAPFGLLPGVPRGWGAGLLTFRAASLEK